MIYVLGKETSNEYEDLDEIVLTASTKIENILKYVLTNLNLQRLYDYSIIFVEENEMLETPHDYLTLSKNLCKYFTEYTPNVFLKEENRDEFYIVKNCLSEWDKVVDEAIRREKEETERKIAAYREESERRLYEQLKAKFEG